MLVLLAYAAGVSAAAAAAGPKPPACNSEMYAARHAGAIEDFNVYDIITNTAAIKSSKTSAVLMKLPQPNGEEATFPAALDGSPYGFYHATSPTKSTKWTIYLQGGGWCYDEVDCLCRSNMSLGTSTKLPPSSGAGCANPLEDGLVDETCNYIGLPYLDGASFSGYRAEPWQVPGTNDTLWFRGIKNLDATLAYAIANLGLDKASEIVVTGTSAGGLSTFLHVDRIAATVTAASPSLKKTTGQPRVGYFQDHDNFGHTTGYPGGPNTPQWALPGTSANYSSWMKYIYSMQNLTFGADGGLTEACRVNHPDDPHLCFMAAHMADTIQSPTFMTNSQFDWWQLLNIFQGPWETPAQMQGVREYGAKFIANLQPMLDSASGQ
jgi:hypothetical protein